LLLTLGYFASDLQNSNIFHSNIVPNPIDAGKTQVDYRRVFSQEFSFNSLGGHPIFGALYI